MVPCQRPGAVPLGWGEEADVGGFHHLVGSSPINPTAMSHAGYVIWKCSYACSYLLFISLIFFFSLPAITVAFNVSNSSPTQCDPFKVIWDYPALAARLYIQPLNDSVVTANRSEFVTKSMTWTFTRDKLPLKTGTQFVFSLGEHGALFSSPLAIYETRVLT